MSIEAKFKIESSRKIQKTNKENFVLEVDLQLPEKGISAIFGPSGCGKTTLLRAMAGLENSPSGFLKIGDLIWQKGNYFLPTHKRPIGYVFQEASLFEHLNVQKNLEYGLKRVPEMERKVSLEKAIELLGIGDLLKRSVNQLSGGEIQRVAIARALAVSPKILLMDEPLSGLDWKRKQEIMPYLETLHDDLDIPVIYVSHSIDEIVRLADYLILLDNGKVQAAGMISDILTRLDLPLAKSDDAAAMIEARVIEHDDAYGLTYLDFQGGKFTIARSELELGAIVRLKIAARDVSLTLEKQSGTSILNIFPAKIEEILLEGNSQNMIRLNANGESFLSRITKKSTESLNLAAGKQIYVQVKSVALLG